MLLRRHVQLQGGLVLYGFSAALILLAGLGADPWDVLHQGLSRRTGIGTGIWVCIVGALVLLLWIPLRQRPGFGTLSNVVVIGLVVEATLALLDPPAALAARVTMLGAGIVLNGAATGLYIGAAFGPGPRDGLMTGLAARGHSLRVVRTGIELTVLAAGAALGGTVGVGTVAYALTIGPLAHVFVPLFATRPLGAAGAVERRQSSGAALDDREDLVEAGDLERLLDVRVGVDDRELAVAGAQPLDGADQHAERRRVEEGRLAEVDDDARGAVLDRLGERLLQLRRGEQVDLAAHRDDVAAPVQGLLGQAELSRHPDPFCQSSLARASVPRSAPSPRSKKSHTSTTFPSGSST